MRAMNSKHIACVLNSLTGNQSGIYDKFQKCPRKRRGTANLIQEVFRQTYVLIYHDFNALISHVACRCRTYRLSTAVCCLQFIGEDLDVTCIFHKSVSCCLSNSLKFLHSCAKCVCGVLAVLNLFIVLEG
jgi:hypothetical protein